MFADRAAMSPRWEPIRKGQRWFYANKGGLGLKTGVRVQDESGNVIGDTGSRVFYAPAPVKRGPPRDGEPVLDIPQDVLNEKDCIQTVQIVQSTSAMAGLSLLVRGLMGVQEGDDRIMLYWERLNELHAQAASSSPPLARAQRACVQRHVLARARPRSPCELRAPREVHAPEGTHGVRSTAKGLVGTESLLAGPTRGEDPLLDLEGAVEHYARDSGMVACPAPPRPEGEVRPVMRHGSPPYHPGQENQDGSILTHE